MTRASIYVRPIGRTRCSICGNSVCLETSNTDEQGSAVHEECYVARTVALFAQQQVKRFVRISVPALVHP